MTIDDTRQIVLSYFNNNKIVLLHNYDKKLMLNGNTFQIRPDDAFYFSDKVVLIEYENNLRPVESISKYFWLFKKTKWVKENFKICLLLTINNSRLEKDYKIRTETIQILGLELKKQYPNLFDFYFINHSDLKKERLVLELNEMSN